MFKRRLLYSRLWCICPLKNNKWDTAIVLRIIGIIVLIVGVATFGILSVIYGILFTIIQTQVIYLLNKSHKVNAKILKPTH